MPQARRRVSYVIPPPTEYVSRLQLPPHGVQRLGAVGPLLTTSEAQPERSEDTPLWARHPRHRLGVASLALDTSTSLAGRNAPEGILYSGGRDGLIISWDLGIPMKKRKVRPSGEAVRARQRWEIMTGWADDTIEEEGEEGEDRIASDGDVLGEVTSSLNIKRQRAASMAGEVPYEQEWETDLGQFSPGTHSEFRQCAQAHSDWVNDILLCNYNQTVVSASSDGTVKAWNPHASTSSDPSIIGSHSDYVRCLALCREQNWVASGSFDRSIKLWDLSRSVNHSSTTTSDPLITFNSADASAPKSSVYALASDPFGHTIASGSPERVIRLWDPRTGKRTGKLVGHTDNIRAILISDDSRYLLTGSADASIKLWSLASQRCLHTFTHHTDSVWSLYSSHPTLETFYSGDRSGFVCRIDVEDCGDLSEGECIVLCNDAGDSRPSSEGINKLLVMDDNLVWTASGTSTIKRWHIPQRRAIRLPVQSMDADGEKLPLSQSPLFKRRLPMGSDLASEASTRPSTGHGQPRRMSSAPSVQSLFADHTRDRDFDNKLNGIPLDSLVKLLSPIDPFSSFTSSRARDPEVATLYSAASVMSVPRATARIQSQNMFQLPHTSPLQSSKTEDTVIPASTARANYEERELAADAIPFCPNPDDILSGEHGLVRSVILNDRLHALTVDTSGEVAVWDIVRGICLGRYLPEDVAAASHAGSVAGGSGERERSPREALETVRERIEGESAVSTWCTADTKAGVLAIHLTERCFEAEVYADEVGFANDSHFNDESKLNLGKWVLRNLFLGFIREELHLHRNSPSAPDGVLPPSISRGELGPGLSPRKSRHRSSSSPESSRKPPRHVPMSSTVINSSKMIPAISPAVTTGFPRSSPLLTTLIPLQIAKDTLPSIPQSATNTPEILPPSTFHQRSRSGTVDGHMTRTPSSAPSKEDYFSARTRQASTQGGVPGTPDDFSGWAGPTKTEPVTPSTPSGLIGRLKNLGKIAKRPISDTASPTLGATTPTAENLILAEDVLEVPKTPVQKLLSEALTPPTTTDAPLYNFPPQTAVLISEEATPSYRYIYRGNVSTTHHDITLLEKAMPIWLAEYLLHNKSPAPPAKLSFVLLPWNKDPDVEPLPELLNTTQSKLTASRYLRISKIIQHVQDKLEKVTAESRAASIRSSVDGYEPHSQPPKAKAEDMYEILCNEALLPLHMTLAAVRQYVWRQSAELVMHYRRKPQLVRSSQTEKPS